MFEASITGAANGRRNDEGAALFSNGVNLKRGVLRDLLRAVLFAIMSPPFKVN